MCRHRAHAVGVGRYLSPSSRRDSRGQSSHRPGSPEAGVGGGKPAWVSQGRAARLGPGLGLGPSAVWQGPGWACSGLLSCQAGVPETPQRSAGRPSARPGRCWGTLTFPDACCALNGDVASPGLSRARGSGRSQRGRLDLLALSRRKSKAPMLKTTVLGKTDSNAGPVALQVSGAPPLWNLPTCQPREDRGRALSPWDFPLVSTLFLLCLFITSCGAGIWRRG